MEDNRVKVRIYGQDYIISGERDEEYKKTLKQFHKLSDRHILAAETDMSFSDIQKDNMK